MKNTAPKFLGFTVDKRSDKVGEVGYHLIGNEKVFFLMRDRKIAHKMYAISVRGTKCGVRGNYHFSDENGKLEKVN